MFRLRHTLDPPNKSNSYTEDCAQHAPIHPLEKCSSPMLGESNKIFARKILHLLFQIDLSLSILFRETWPKKGAPLSEVPKCFVEGKVGSHVSKYSFLREKHHAIKGV